MFTSWESHSVLAGIRRLTGKQYRQLEIELENLSPGALQDLRRLLNDVETQTRSIERTKIRYPR